MGAWLDVSPGPISAKVANKIWATKLNVFKIECCGSYGQLPTKKRSKKCEDL
jgi:hypothetical protein